LTPGKSARSGSSENPGQWCVPPAAPARREIRMGAPQALGLGFIAGMVLFFVLQRMGIIDRLLQRLDR